MRRLLTLVTAIALILSAQQVRAENKWYLSLYGGQAADSTLGSLFSGSADFQNAYLLALAVERGLVTFWDNKLRLEAEGIVVKHFGRQDHVEFDALIIARWLYFPWNHCLTTTFAVGNGLSVATEVPEFEKETHKGNATQVLDYLMFELTFGLPQLPRWSLLTRIHHRSGVYGLFDGVNGGSNFICVGLRYEL